MHFHSTVDSAFRGTKGNYVGGERVLKYILTEGEDGKIYWKNRALKGAARVDQNGILAN